MVYQKILHFQLLILTDLFDDVKNYQKIYYEMHDHLNTITTADTVFDGLAIFLLLKCAAVLGTVNLTFKNMFQMLFFYRIQLVMMISQVSTNLLIR